MSKGYNNQLLLDVSVVDVLSYFGKRVDHRRYMYFSPFRDEAEPSMKVSQLAGGGSVWYDFGMGEGGGVKDMVARLLGVSLDSERVMETIHEIAGKPRQEARADEPARISRSPKESAIVVVSAVPVDGEDNVVKRAAKRRLLNYFTVTRGIPMEVLSYFCKVVCYYSVDKPEVHIAAIGFENNAGGYALRGTGRLKSNSKWAVTTLDSRGKLCPVSVTSCDKGELFEGFTNFLSKVAYRYNGGLGIEPGVDTCVLHSASNVAHSRNWVLAHKRIRTFFDNDAAGDRATEIVRSWCEEAGIDFKDGRSAYLGYNDINEALVANIKQQQEAGRSQGRTM